MVTEESVTTVVRWVIVLDNIVDAAGGARDRKRAVFETVHCAQTSRLDPGWNQANVHPSFDGVSKSFVGSPPVSQFSCKLARGDGERGFIAWIALAENPQPHIV